jgi:hypothetical protein
MNAKDFLRRQTIPRLTQAVPDFPYVSLSAIRRDLKAHKIIVQPATLPRYLHDLAKEGVIFDAGRAWYSTLATPFTLNREPVQELVDLLEKQFPFLDFSVWSTAQIASYGHHLLARFVSFVYTAKDAMESVADVLRDNGHSAYIDPTLQETARNLRMDDKTVIVLPEISGAPTDGKFATIEKILVDLYVEIQTIHLMDVLEFKRLMTNILSGHRVAIGTLIRYAENRRDLQVQDFIGAKINQ